VGKEVTSPLLPIHEAKVAHLSSFPNPSNMPGKDSKHSFLDILPLLPTSGQKENALGYRPPLPYTKHVKSLLIFPGTYSCTNSD